MKPIPSPNDPDGHLNNGPRATPLSVWQRAAIERWTLIPEEQARPSFSHVTAAGTFVLTVRAGWG